MITMSEFLMGRITYDQLSLELKDNANNTVDKANQLLDTFGSPRGCNSGYRSIADQARINPKAPKSKHMTCEAIDISDKDGKLKKFCIANQDILESIGLWMESPNSTPTWVHVQITPPNSGHRIFIP